MRALQQGTVCGTGVQAWQIRSSRPDEKDFLFEILSNSFCLNFSEKLCEKGFVLAEGDPCIKLWYFSPVFSCLVVVFEGHGGMGIA